MPRLDRTVYFDRAIIWTDYVAVAVFMLIAFGLALNYVGSDAPAREAAYKARVAKLAEACGPPKEASAAPMPPAGDQRSTDTLASEGLAPDGVPPPEPASSAAPSAAVAPAETAPAQPETQRLPDRLCADEQMRIDEEAPSARAPTLHDLGMQIGEAGLFLALPLWVGLRIFDYRTGGPMRRLARSPYWRATRDARRELRQRRQSRKPSRKDGPDQPYESS